MNIKEEFIAPGLSAVILLAAIGFALSGASVFVWIVLGILGLAALATYFMPAGAQVEVRTGVAVLGLLVLLLHFAFLYFWLALLAFGAMGALQLRYRAMLQMPPRHTVDYVMALAGRLPAKGAEDGEAAPATPVALQRLGTAGRRLRLNVAGIAGAVLGVFALLSIFMPWTIFLVDSSSEASDELSREFTLLEAAEELEDDVLAIFFVVLLALGVLGIASILLPRWAAALIGVAGVGVTPVSYIYILAQFLEAHRELSAFGIDSFTWPYLGSFLAGFCFLLLALLQLIPGFNRRKSRNDPPPA